MYWFLNFCSSNLPLAHLVFQFFKKVILFSEWIKKLCDSWFNVMSYCVSSKFLLKITTFCFPCKRDLVHKCFVSTKKRLRKFLKFSFCPSIPEFEMGHFWFFSCFILFNFFEIWFSIWKVLSTLRFFLIFKWCKTRHFKRSI